MKKQKSQCESDRYEVILKAIKADSLSKYN